MADADLGDFDVDAYRSLVTTAEDAGEVRLGPVAERAMSELPDDDVRRVMTVLLDGIVDDTEDVMLQRVLLEFVRDHPLEAPAFDPHDIDRVLDTLGTLDDDGRRAT